MIISWGWYKSLIKCTNEQILSLGRIKWLILLCLEICKTVYINVRLISKVLMRQVSGLVETGCSTWTSGIEICSWPTGWPLWRWPLWWGVVCWEGWPAAVVWGGCQEADQVHWGHHTRQELPLVVSRSSAHSHAVCGGSRFSFASCNM